MQRQRSCAYGAAVPSLRNLSTAGPAPATHTAPPNPLGGRACHPGPMAAAGSGRSRSRPALDLSVMIRRPPSEVFALLADIQEAEPLPRRAVVRMEKDPAGQTAVGTRWHEAVRLAPGCWFGVESIVTEVEPPTRLGMDFSTRWFRGHLSYEIEPTPEGCILHHRDTLCPRALLPWLPAIIAPRLRPHIVERLADIRDLLEMPERPRT